MPRSMDNGMQHMTLPVKPPYRLIFRLRWTLIRGPRHFLRLLIGRTDMRSFGGFRPRKRRRLALERSNSLLQCWKGKRRFIPNLPILGGERISCHRFSRLCHFAFRKSPAPAQLCPRLPPTYPDAVARFEESAVRIRCRVGQIASCY